MKEPVKIIEEIQILRTEIEDIPLIKPKEKLTTLERKLILEYKLEKLTSAPERSESPIPITTLPDVIKPSLSQGFANVLTRRKFNKKAKIYMYTKKVLIF